MKNKTYKTYILIGVYVLLLIVELFLYVPYEKIEVFRSKQNVPHTQVVGNGYASIQIIQNNSATIDGDEWTTTGKRLDSSQVIINVSITTALAVIIYFLFIYKKTNSAEAPDNAFKESLNSLKKQNVQLQKTIDTLYTENQQLIKDKNECEKLLLKKIQADSPEDCQSLPCIDINGLAFATEEQREQAKRKYAIDMYRYVANLPSPRTFDEASTATEEMFENSEQFSLEDVLINEPPYLDINELAFADEETVKRMQKQHTEKLYLYIKNRLDKEQG